MTDRPTLPRQLSPELAAVERLVLDRLEALRSTIDSWLGGQLQPSATPTTGGMGPRQTLAAALVGFAQAIEHDARHADLLAEEMRS